MLKKAAIILARTDSERFPEKALHLINGKTLLEWCISSVYPNNYFAVILATTKREIDNPLVELAKKNNIKYYRGDTDNVAKRILDCADYYNIDIFARVNGDSPFIIKELLIEGMKKVESGYDFATNLVPRRFPYGISVEVFNTNIFRQTLYLLKTKDYQEHVTKYFYENINNFKPYFIKYNYGNDHDIRLVVDKKEDTVIISKIIENIKNKTNFTVNELVEIYKQIK